MFAILVFIVVVAYVASSCAASVVSEKVFSDTYREVVTATTVADSGRSIQLEDILSNLEARASEPFHYLMKEEGRKLEIPAQLEANNIAGYLSIMQFSDSSCNDYTYSYGILLNYCTVEKCIYPDLSTGFCSVTHVCDGSTVSENTYLSENCTGILNSSYTNTISKQCYNTGGYNFKSSCVAAASGAPLPSDSYISAFYDDSTCSQQPVSFYGIASGLCVSGANASFTCDSNDLSYTYTYTVYNDSECSVAPKSYPQAPPLCLLVDNGNDDSAEDDTYKMEEYIQRICTGGSGSDSSSSGLGAGVIAGIAIGTIAVVAAIGFGVYYWLFKYRISVLDTKINSDNDNTSSAKQDPMSSAIEL